MKQQIKCIKQFMMNIEYEILYMNKLLKIFFKVSQNYENNNNLSQFKFAHAQYSIKYMQN